MDTQLHCTPRTVRDAIKNKKKVCMEGHCPNQGWGGGKKKMSNVKLVFHFLHKKVKRKLLKSLLVCSPICEEIW